MPRVVFDVNVLISGVIWIGKPKLLIDAVVDGRMTLILSDEIMREFKTVIAREKFKLDEEKQAAITNFILNLGRIVRMKNRLRVVREDPKDDIIVNTAMDGRVDYIVSGDDHLLALKEFRGMRIVSVSEMLELLKEGATRSGPNT